MCPLCSLSNYLMRFVKSRNVSIEATHILALFVALTIFFCEAFLKDYAKQNWRPLQKQFSFKQNDEMTMTDDNSHSFLQRWIPNNNHHHHHSKSFIKLTGASVQTDINTGMKNEMTTNDMNHEVNNKQKTNNITNESNVTLTHLQLRKAPVPVLTNDIQSPSTPLPPINDTKSEKKSPLTMTKTSSTKQIIQLNQDVTTSIVTSSQDNFSYFVLILHKLLKTYEIKNIIDPSCNPPKLPWFSPLLTKTEFDIPNFNYICIVPDSYIQKIALTHYANTFDQLEIVKQLQTQQPWNLNITQLNIKKKTAAILWNSIGFWSPNFTWQFIKKLKDSGITYVLLPNYPDVMHNKVSSSIHGRVNVRRTPYRFNLPLRIINNMSTDVTMPKQLLLYNLSDIRTDITDISERLL